MSVRKSYSILCPKCGAEGAVELYDAVNVGEEPALRDDLLANRLNSVACHACRFEFRVDKPLLYHDPGRGFAIWWNPAGEGAPEEAEEAFDAMRASLAEAAGGSAPALHLVFTRAELVERIFLLEAGLDERVIEYIKYLVYSKNGARVDPHAKRLLFNAQDSTADELCFVVQDVASRRLETMLRYSREAYAGLKEMMASDSPTPLRDLFPGPYVSARRLAME